MQPIPCWHAESAYDVHCKKIAAFSLGWIWSDRLTTWLLVWDQDEDAGLTRQTFGSTAFCSQRLELPFFRKTDTWRNKETAGLCSIPIRVINMKQKVVFGPVWLLKRFDTLHHMRFMAASLNKLVLARNPMQQFELVWNSIKHFHR